MMLALTELSVCNWHILIHISCKDGSSKVASAPSGVLVEHIGSSGASALVDVGAVINGSGYSCLSMEDEPLFCLPPPSCHAPFVM